MTRAVHDNYDERLRDEPIVGSIATELTRAAHDVRLVARRIKAGVCGDAAVDTITVDLPALTAPLVVARPDSEHWVLIGSLMEDLRRIREEIIGKPVG